MRLIDNDIPVWGNPIDEESVKQIIRSRRTAYRAAMMPDHHKGYSVPIGGVLAYKDSISPSGVGYDIACGNKAVRTDAYPQDVIDRIDTIMDDIVSTISFGIGRRNNEDVDHDLFYQDVWSMHPLSGLKDLARAQLGTVGSGNHYVDIFLDEVGRVWIGVHFGSRGLGHKIATYFLEAGGASDSMDSPPLVIPVSSPLGSDYLACMNIAGQYAYAGRDWVCDRVAKILGANIDYEVHNHHNFAWLENHDGKNLWVVRKGSTPAFPNQMGFVGGSMGDDAVIIQGLCSRSEDSYWALDSAIHGAGRIMSRTQAAGKMDRKTRTRSGGQITVPMMQSWIEEKRVTLRGAGTDEAPQAYKRLENVLLDHPHNIRVVYNLRPIGVAMAGEHEYDPYKD